MPSPFPGMDPYLESAEWTSVHHNLTSAIGRRLAPKVSPKYVVRTEERFVLEILDDVGMTRTSYYPDFGVAETKATYEATQTHRGITPPVLLRALMPTPVPHVTLEIRSVTNRELVTAIEIISPTNKRGEGYWQYVDKRNRLLNTSAHLMEIDLLRPGKRIPMQDLLPPAPYFVFLSRVDKRPLVDVWPIQLADVLPTVPIPLLAGDDDVALDLQLALNAVYDAFRYDLTVDYSRPSEVALAGETAVFAQTILVKSGAIQAE